MSSQRKLGSITLKYWIPAFAGMTALLYMNYNHQKIEKKWQKEWAKSGYKLWRSQDPASTKATAGKAKKYVLDMFPYPSGEGLHVGHLLGYVGSDILSRYYRMRSYNVLHPMGWDAFGLPAENYAIKHKIHPSVAVKINIKNFKKQLNAPGFSYDWSREINTTDPEYYKWTQWIFLQLFKKGLAYEAELPVNWCPKDKTVLANEEVVDGCCERCGSKVERKKLKQWVLKITAYADRLVDDLKLLDWPEKVKELQRNWIGRSEGALLKFPITNFQLPIKVAPRQGSGTNFIEVFTTRPDTLAGATYLVLAPEHLFIKNLEPRILNSEEVKKYIEATKNKSDRERQENKEKTGVELKGVKAINPLTKEEIPVWISDYVLSTYGTGAIMAVPQHDERDMEFAVKFNLPIVDKPLIPKDEVIKKVNGKKTINYKLRDWIFSRQRYWGEPIPVIKCAKCGTIPVLENELPIKLPKVKSYEPTGTGESPLAAIDKWVNVKCPNCKGPAKRETNTMPQWAGSCWYYLGYLLGNQKSKIKNQKSKIKNQKSGLVIFKNTFDHWIPVDLYIGGVEHAVLHLLYARFWHKFLYDIGVVGTKEPFQKLMNQGLMMGPDGAKMSKSKGNVISPDEMIKLFGADALRMYEMFMGPFEDSKSWDPHGITGISRFLNRVWVFTEKNRKTKKSEEVASRSLQKTIKKVTEDIENFHFNTAISAMMIMLNEVESLPISGKELLDFAKILSPFAPHMAQEIAAQLGFKKLLDYEPWPKWDESKIVENTFKLVIQVNGKVRLVLDAKKGISEDEAKDLALQNEIVKKWVGGAPLKKVIFVKDRLINLII